MDERTGHIVEALSTVYDASEARELARWVVEELPEDASLSVSTCILAHVADRETVYELYYHGADDDVDYVVIDCRGGMDERESRLCGNYLSQGYTIRTQLPGLLIVLQKPPAA